MKRATRVRSTFTHSKYRRKRTKANQRPILISVSALLFPVPASVCTYIAESHSAGDGTVDCDVCVVCRVLEVDKPYVPASCCVRDSDGQYENKYRCQMSIDRPPGRRHGKMNKYLFYPVSNYYTFTVQVKVNVDSYSASS